MNAGRSSAGPDTAPGADGEASGPGTDGGTDGSAYVAAYLRRIGLHPENALDALDADAATLRAVHRAHAYALPFENIDPVLGTVPSLTAADLDAKMVRGGRGGYCYEQNTLLANALVALGFRVTLLAARVLVGTDDIASRPRTHMALLVEPVAGEDGSGQTGGGQTDAGRAAEGRTPYLADVGFGAPGALLEPVPLVADTVFTAEGRTHRLVRLPHDGPSPMWALEARGGNGWARQYAFTREPFERPDFDVINWHIATNPRSPFSRRLFVQRALPGSVHRALTDGTFTETRDGGAVRTYDVRSDAALREALTGEFGITPPDGADLAPAHLAARRLTP
ncbi:arylamine N-acetyltransferase family protein [Streptomyces fuscigenes]|uniref:arylamine N-acetyltransferase family protein n=1 Tax=Streptomyces fuscigenes TaxID=1528880 RepID=UPI001F47CAEB|nr:arylamine N-acetyltransferase [Streptomyces fuscigenes]MCF3960577.1 arylamine N-acetyltransferase [Streptomyces fuscigenes]